MIVSVLLKGVTVKSLVTELVPGDGHDRAKWHFSCIYLGNLSLQLYFMRLCLILSSEIVFHLISLLHFPTLLFYLLPFGKVHAC